MKGELTISGRSTANFCFKGTLMIGAWMSSMGWSSFIWADAYQEIADRLHPQAQAFENHQSSVLKLGTTHWNMITDDPADKVTSYQAYINGFSGDVLNSMGPPLDFWSDQVAIRFNLPMLGEMEDFGNNYTDPRYASTYISRQHPDDWQDILEVSQGISFQGGHASIRNNGSLSHPLYEIQINDAPYILAERAEVEGRDFDVYYQWGVADWNGTQAICDFGQKTRFPYDAFATNVYPIGHPCYDTRFKSGLMIQDQNSQNRSFASPTMDYTHPEADRLARHHTYESATRAIHSTAGVGVHGEYLLFPGFSDQFLDCSTVTPQNYLQKLPLEGFAPHNESFLQTFLRRKYEDSEAQLQQSWGVASIDFESVNLQDHMQTPAACLDAKEWIRETYIQLKTAHYFEAKRGITDADIPIAISSFEAFPDSYAHGRGESAEFFGDKPSSLNWASEHHNYKNSIMTFFSGEILTSWTRMLGLDYPATSIPFGIQEQPCWENGRAPAGAENFPDFWQPTRCIVQGAFDRIFHQMIVGGVTRAFLGYFKSLDNWRIQGSENGRIIREAIAFLNQNHEQLTMLKPYQPKLVVHHGKGVGRHALSRIAEHRVPFSSVGPNSERTFEKPSSTHRADYLFSFFYEELNNQTVDLLRHATKRDRLFSVVFMSLQKFLQLDLAELRMTGIFPFGQQLWIDLDTAGEGSLQLLLFLNQDVTQHDAWIDAAMETLLSVDEGSLQPIRAIPTGGQRVNYAETMTATDGTGWAYSIYNSNPTEILEVDLQIHPGIKADYPVGTTFDGEQIVVVPPETSRLIFLNPQVPGLQANQVSRELQALKSAWLARQAQGFEVKPAIKLLEEAEQITRPELLAKKVALIERARELAAVQVVPLANGGVKLRLADHQGGPKAGVPVHLFYPFMKRDGIALGLTDQNGELTVASPRQLYLSSEHEPKEYYDFEQQRYRLPTGWESHLEFWFKLGRYEDLQIKRVRL